VIDDATLALARMTSELTAMVASMMDQQRELIAALSALNDRVSGLESLVIHD
jgi:hypothetical protein